MDLRIFGRLTAVTAVTPIKLDGQVSQMGSVQPFSLPSVPTGIQDSKQISYH